MDKPGFRAPNYSPIPNDYVDRLLREIDTIAELKVTLAVFRKTFGWHKRTDRISISQLQSVTGLGRAAVVAGANRACERGTLRRDTSGGTATFSVEVWFDDDDQVVRSANQGGSTSELGGGSLSEPTKETPKERDTKEKKDPTSAPAEDRAQLVWDHYDRVFPGSRGGLSDSRRRMIERGLKDFDVAALCTAVDGLKRWRSSRPGDTSLSAIFKTRPGGSSFTDQVEFWIAQGAGSSSRPPGVPSADRAIVQQRQQDVQRGHRLRTPEAVEKAREAEAWLKQHGIVTERRESDGYPVFRPESASERAARESVEDAA